jgi:sulfur carrier protein
MNTPLATEHITIELDGRAHELPSGTSLADLVQSQGHSEQAVATAVNRAFVPRGQRAATILRPGDQVLFFQPIVGG